MVYVNVNAKTGMFVVLKRVHAKGKELSSAAFVTGRKVEEIFQRPS